MWDASSNAVDIAKQIEKLANSQMPYAIARSLNDTTEDVLEAVNMEILRAFDRPTPWTQKAFKVRKTAKKDYLLAAVDQKDDAKSRNYLETEAYGGPRPQTGLERLLDAKVAYAGVLRTMLPATSSADSGARLDNYGNWSSGQRNELLANIGAMSDPLNNTPSVAKLKARNPGMKAKAEAKLKAKALTRYFIPRATRNGDGGLAPGVYRRDSNKVLKIILAFSDAVPTYTPRFNFDTVAEAAARAAFPDHLRRRLAEAISSSR